MITLLNRFARTKVWIALVILALCAPVLLYWGFDRDRPTKFVGLKSVTKMDDRTYVLVQSVARSRACDTDIPVRYVESPVGARLYLQPVSLSREEMARLMHESPEEVRMIIGLPAAHLPGDWTYHINLEFVCNPVHVIFPIRDRYSFKFQVQ